MAHFVLFIPGGRQTVGALASVGLAHLADQVSYQEIPRGPDTTTGLLCSWVTNRGTLRGGFDPKTQDWIPAIDGGEDLPEGRYWVGFFRDSPPTPEDLERSLPYAGQKLTLGDGNEWRLPCIAGLPRDMIRSGSGETVFEIPRRFHHLTLAADDWKRTLSGLVPGAQVLWSELRNFIEDALTVNYRLTPEVADRLRLYSAGESGTVWRSVSALLWPETVKGASDG